MGGVVNGKIIVNWSIMFGVPVIFSILAIFWVQADMLHFSKTVIGVVGALIIGIILKRFTFRTFLQALVESGKTASLVFIVLIGAVMFSRFIAWCNLSKVIRYLIIGFNLSPGGFMALILFSSFFSVFYWGLTRGRRYHGLAHVL